MKLPKFDKVIIHYRLYPKTHRKTDIGNVIAVHQKFFEDALSELGKIVDDNYKYVIGATMEFGKVDKNNSRVEIRIQPIK